ncbi:50S ribosomal protein L9 [Streptobacillus moniliformis]|uniref:Large ribosomal subunit protein bL9 n=1 Tax=Streptobacillus moniliformis (strain ATCC 14647 / DSM 12112 / NCTC 10651 / 9901) TaxID=519441 RepID=D1AY36_STRM9|nr:50S ribosomal protein L9 [Streptobacillus moniliformis]ACZ01212.1 ribosomal protein L9 [Streptobacillus moniliformis DSM 12112]AVL42429.1 50S ribosomal protein L9 [Streptobacillus moniliformis]QXW65959.1 50S ribosomal protein L9 [Streptobacillus moniliformis]SQA13634.1 BL17 [Streptobacillus moniliformis]
MKVKVILKENIKGVGKKDEIIEVKDGYANNFLFAQNKAVPATPENINKLENKKNKISKNIEREVKHANEIKEILEKNTITLKVKLGKDGKVFGSLGAKEIEEAVKQQLQVEIDKKKMGNDARLKSIGLHNVEIKLYADIKAILKVNVTSL